MDSLVTPGGTHSIPQSLGGNTRPGALLTDSQRLISGFSMENIVLSIPKRQDFLIILSLDL
ncbi:hypothetical protein SBV1_120029 [Verrucomicrobia bacterium]|nr:hypothetical protein SBV1_120029 [Verrucomicrobiota bacterium]